MLACASKVQINRFRGDYLQFYKFHQKKESLFIISTPSRALFLRGAQGGTVADEWNMADRPALGSFPVLDLERFLRCLI